MAKKKKKSFNQANRDSERTRIKLERAAYYKVLNKLTQVLEISKEIEAFSKKDKQILFELRYKSPKIVVVSKSDKLKKLSRSFTKDLIHYAKSTSFKIDDTSFTYFEFCTVLYPFFLHLKIREKELSNLTSTENVQSFLTFCESDNTPDIILQDVVDHICHSLTYPEKRVWYAIKSSESKAELRAFIYSIEFGVPEIKKAYVEGNWHTAIALAFSDRGLQFSNLKTSFLPKHLRKAKSLDVFFQKHAWERLQERLDCCDKGDLYAHMAISIREATSAVHHSNDTVLIPYLFFKRKFGYLMVTVSDKIAVVRTFLFLTNDGTPEGQKLNEILGTVKKDKEYTRLDRLSTYLTSDVKDDEVLSDILKKSDCESLIDVPPKFVEALTKVGTNEIKELAESIKGYLELDDEAHILPKDINP